MAEDAPLGVEIVREGDVGRIVLARPRALNALDLAMVQAIHDALASWMVDPVRVVLIESASDRAFCAGGDIRQIRQNTLDGDLGASDAFFATEYDVNHVLANFPSPVVSLIDGVCLGGGLGLTVHGPFRVVTERASLAMPETGIGFFPDVGASYFLSRLPGGLGAYLGLTGARIGAADAMDIGLATHFVESAALAEIPRRLAESGRSVDHVLRELTSSPPSRSDLADHRQAVDATFTGPDVPSILARLRDHDSPWASKTLGALERMSPQSLDLTLDLIMWGKQRTLRQCLDAEREAARSIVLSHDFVEGVRAALVDKDRSPRWGEASYRGMSSVGVPRWSSQSHR